MVHHRKCKLSVDQVIQELSQNPPPTYHPCTMGMGEEKQQKKQSSDGGNCGKDDGVMNSIELEGFVVRATANAAGPSTSDTAASEEIEPVEVAVAKIRVEDMGKLRAA